MQDITRLHNKHILYRRDTVFPQFFLLFLFLLFLSGCSRGNSGLQDPSANDSDLQISRTGFCLNTVVSITINGTEDTSLMDACFARIQEYEQLFSRTIEGSDIWNINHSSGTPVTVSAETADLLQLALDYCILSDGAFDITVAPLTSLWDFTGEGPHTVPAPEDIESALSHVDYRTIIIDGTTVTLEDPLAAIDLGAIAKGYIADRIREFLVDSGIASGYIDLGGNILTIGTKPDGKAWNIGIRKPFGGASEAIAVVPIRGQSVVTSGTYERYFESDGRLYHHLLDPQTGYPAENGLSSVTILSDDSAVGDALSTACFVSGLEKGLELIESIDHVEALFITNENHLYKSSGFPDTD